jgi:inosine-uridine nucleoside N-ribohydrolase
VAVHGHNGLGGVELPAPRRQSEALAAADAIADLAQTHPGALSLLALGPLSNVALALERCPELPGLLREVVVMGGVFGIGGQRGNVSPVAEANMAADPLAADRVLGSGLSLRLVSLDVTHQTLLDAPLLERIVQDGGEAGAFIRDTAQTYLDFYSPITGQRACPLHDASAAICLLEPSLFHYEQAAVRVVSDGIALGQTIPGDPQADYMSAAWRGRPRCSYTTGVDTGAVRATLLDCLRCEYQLWKNSPDLPPADE